jgi:hypothetical protein
LLIFWLRGSDPQKRQVRFHASDSIGGHSVFVVVGRASYEGVCAAAEAEWPPAWFNCDRREHARVSLASQVVWSQYDPQS